VELYGITCLSFALCLLGALADALGEGGAVGIVSHGVTPER